MFISDYYNTVQLWADVGADYQELREFFDTNHFEVVFSSVEVLKKLKYEPEKPGFILAFCENDVDVTDCGFKIQKQPEIEDFKKIAKLIAEDSDISSGMECKDIEERLKSRYLSNFSRDYFCIDGDSVIAHAGTYAESDDMCVIGGVIVHPQYRGQHIASNMVQELCSDLTAEGKKPYLMAHTEEALHIYKKMGFKEYSSWASHKF